MKILWKNLSTRIWLIVSVTLIVIFLAVNLIVMQSALIYETFNIVFGGQRYETRGDTSKYNYYTSDYDSKLDALAAANSLNEKIVSEGIVLLKNEDNVLPLTGSEIKVSVFGKNSVNMVYGGSGSGARDASKAVSIYDSLTAAGIKYNPTLKSFYENNSQSGTGRPESPKIGAGGGVIPGFAIGETPQANYETQGVRSSYGEYDDAALVLFSRIGGEGFDLPRSMIQPDSDWNPTANTVPGARSKDDHYLQLDANETDLLSEVCENFQNVIVILNCSPAMELGFLDDPSHYAYNEKIKGALWIGNTGETGGKAIGAVLKGDTNPSGRTVDIFPRDFKKDPSWKNFSTNLVDNGDAYTDENDVVQNAHFVRYEEGIYVGYRYYETRGFTEQGQWYDDNVVYPFGYGLGYSEFDWDVTEVRVDGSNTKTALDKDSKIEVDVKVTHKSGPKGKEVVQLYVTAPYTENGIEKSHVTLAGFEKTPMLYSLAEANSEDKLNSCTATISLTPYDFASYDYSDANGNGFKGYEVEAGSYEFKVSSNSHYEEDSFSLNVAGTGLSATGITQEATNGANGFTYTEGAEENVIVENRFDEVSDYIDIYLSRGNWQETFPQTPQDRGCAKVDAAFLLPFSDYTVTSGYDSGQPWYKPPTQKPSQPKKVLSDKEASIKLYDLIGKDYDDKLWDELLNQLTVSQMSTLIGQGAFKTNAISNIGKPETIDYDGPGGFAAFMSINPDSDVCFYASECIIAATWNKQLAYDMGIAIGNESIWGMTKNNYRRAYSGWYAPAVNIHRSQFGGRNFEYYSEDGFLSGKMAAKVCFGAKEKGLYTYLKHFALNEQEGHRDANGLATWANEQSMREIYFKPFEIAVKEGKTTAIMSSFNRIGTEWAGSSYALLTEILRHEWGFKGMVISDFNTSATPYMNADKMIRGGGDLNLMQDGQPSSNTSALTATHLHTMRTATKNILYTVANSNAMNGLGDGVEIITKIPLWQELMFWADGLVVLGLAVWGFFVVRSALKKKKELDLN